MDTDNRETRVMEKRLLGKSGLVTSAIGLGCWQLGGDFGPVDNVRAFSVLAAADKAGIHFWDTADVYGSGLSESRIGAWQRQNPASRVIVSKVGRNSELHPNGYQYDRMRRSIEGSLERLQVSSLDMVQLHCIPFEVLKGDQVWRWLEDFRSEGLIKHYGASVETVEEGLDCLKRPGLTSLQIILNIFRQDAVEALLPAAAEAGVGIIARLPLASGLLSGKFNAQTSFDRSDHRNFNADGQAFNVGETFSGLGLEKGVALTEKLKTLLPADVPLAQLALRWILDFPEVSSVIAGASSVEQVKQNAAAAVLPPLTKEQHQQLRDFYYNDVRPLIRGNI
ncbi:MAG TPA: aldo/keto reductase [Marinagarivorans sp.]